MIKIPFSEIYICTEASLERIGKALYAMFKAQVDAQYDELQKVIAINGALTEALNSLDGDDAVEARERVIAVIQEHGA